MAFRNGRSDVQKRWREFGGNMESGSGNSSDRKYDPGKERQRLMELGSFLGHADIEMQIRYLDRYLEEFADAIKERQSMLGEKKKLYRSLGVIGGILIAVMLI